MTAKQTFKTTRMSIDIPIKDHRRIKIMAAAEGLSLRNFVIECINEKIHPEKQFKKSTRKAIADARKGKTFKAKNFEELCKDLGI